jgi:hypothetical protein
MFGKLAVFGGITLLSTITAGSMVASAGPTAIQSVLPEATSADTSVIHKAQWRRCRFWRDECAVRWDWGTWEYRRCLRRHDC